MKTKLFLLALLAFSILYNIHQYEEYKDLEGGLNPCEYQFVATDDSVSVNSYDRYVGTIKLDGSLEKLINEDNE
jgi:hypothetical protein